MLSSCLSYGLLIKDPAARQRLDYFQGRLENVSNSFYALFWLYSHDLLYVSRSIENVLDHPLEKFMEHGMVYFQNIIPSHLISHIYEPIYSRAAHLENHPDYIFAKDCLNMEAAVFNSKMEEVPVTCNALFLDVKPFFPTSYLLLCSWIDIRNIDRRMIREKSRITQSILYSIKKLYIKSKPEHFNSLRCRNKISEREKEVALLLMNGHSTKSISDILQITFNTVESHRKHLLEKLEAKNTPELIHKLINIPL